MSSLESNIQRTLDILLPQLSTLRETLDRPIILGITGLQGSGKSTWASAIVGILESQHHLHAITVSLDDFYKTHEGLVAQREKDPSNLLYRTRGQPGTHDEKLACDFFDAVKQGERSSAVRIPRFDKSRFGGEGDREPDSLWPQVERKVDVVVFEGWCVGFRALPESIVTAKHEASKASKREDTRNEAESTSTLADHRLEHLLEVNRSLKRYNETFMGPQNFDLMIHIDTDNLRNVYRWRGQQEKALIDAKGSGMSYEAVVAFVRGYMPAYELYLEGLRDGFFGPRSSRQVRVVLGPERELEKLDMV